MRCVGIVLAGVISATAAGHGNSPPGPIEALDDPVLADFVEQNMTERQVREELQLDAYGEMLRDVSILFGLEVSIIIDSEASSPCASPDSPSDDMLDCLEAGDIWVYEWLPSTCANCYLDCYDACQTLASRCWWTIEYEVTCVDGCQDLLAWCCGC